MRDHIKIVENYLTELTSREKFMGRTEVQAFKTATKTFQPAVNSGSSQHNHNLLKQFLKFMKTKGYRPMASGAFGAVFTHPKLDYVIKVFKNDPGYANFISICSANRRDEHLPKFRGKIIQIDETTSMVRIERLKPVGNSVEPIVDALQDYLAMSGVGPEEYLECLEGEAEESEDAEMLLDYFYANVGLLQTAMLIRDENAGHQLDLSLGNVMWRQDTLVIIDPYASFVQPEVEAAIEDAFAPPSEAQDVGNIGKS